MSLDYTAEDACDEAAKVYLGDPQLQYWNFTNLIPFLRAAHRDMQLELDLNDIDVTRKTSTIVTIQAGWTAMGVGSNLQPTDLIEPLEMAERQAGNTNDLFDPMVQTSWEVDDLQAPTLRYWNWDQETIQFLGATTNRDVKLHYIAGLTIPQSANDSLGWINSITYLAPHTAALAASDVGNVALASRCEMKANQALDKLIRINLKPMQDRPIRRLPYRRKRFLRDTIGGY